MIQAQLLTHKDYITQRALILTYDKAKADDLVQETYYKAFKNLDKFEEGSNTKAWLYTILKNEFINIYRKARSREKGIIEVYPDPEFFPEKEDMSYINFGEPTYSEIVWNAIDRLNESEYNTMVLILLEGYKYEEAAEMLNKPIGTIKSNVHRIRLVLRKHLRTYAKSQGIKTK